MGKTFIAFILLASTLSVYAQSQGELMLKQAESDLKEMNLDFTTHEIKKIQSDYEHAVTQLLIENNMNLVGKAYCRLGELEMNNPEQSKKYFSEAYEIAKGTGSDLELEAMIAVEMWNGIMGDPIQAWNRVKKNEPQQDSFDSLEDYISILELMALTAGRAEDMTEVHRLFETIISIDCGDNYQAISKQVNAITDYSDLLLQYRLYEQSLSMISLALDKVLFLMNEGMLPLIWGHVLYSAGLSFIYCDEHETAIDYLKEAIAYYKLVFGDDYIELMHARKQLANVLITSDIFDEAFLELDSAIVQAYSLFGDTNHELMTANSYYSYGYIMSLQFEKARERALESVRIAKVINSTELEPYLMLTISDWFLKDYLSTLKDARELLERCILNTRHNLISLPEKDRELFWVSHGAQTLQIIANASIKAPQDDGLLYDAALFYKGVLLNASQQIDYIISGDQTGTLSQLRDRYRTLSFKADYLAQGDEESQKESEIIRKEAHNAEFEFLSASKDLRILVDVSECTWKDVENVLKDNEAAIEFLRYEDFDKQTKYVASILKHGYAPINIPLVGVNDKYIIQQAKEKAYSSTDFYSKVLAPLLPYLTGCNTVWFSPSGALSSIAIENIKVPKNQYASDLFSFRRLSSTRNLAYPKNDSQWKTAALFGGIDYNLSNEDVEYYAEVATHRGFECKHDWGYLKGSLDEVNNIYRLLHDVQTDLVVAGEGVKERFQALSGKKTNLIHIATHGFYLEDINELVGNEAANIEDQAMNTCGLVFAGANNNETSNSQSRGLLSAAEIANMDLSECNLVVLSACGTGLNIINYDESYGLMRAFKKAGCNSLLLTLWDIDDAVTSLFMQEFYKAKLSGQTNVSSMDIARKIVRSQYRAPKYWAGFILID